jgi:RNA recognition motif-containing protein
MPAAALMHPAQPRGPPPVSAKTHADAPTGDPATCASQSFGTDDPNGPRQVIVNGIATATTADDVRDVFETWAPGCVERVNLPLRRSGHHRGYAFVYLADTAVAARAIVELTGHARLSSEIRGSGINVQWANQRAAAPPAAPPHSSVVGTDNEAPAQNQLPPLASVTAASSASSVMSACGGKGFVPVPTGPVVVP